MSRINMAQEVAIKVLRNAGLDIPEIARELSTSKNTIYRHLSGEIQAKPRRMTNKEIARELRELARKYEGS